MSSHRLPPPRPPPSRLSTPPPRDRKSPCAVVEILGVKRIAAAKVFLRAYSRCLLAHRRFGRQRPWPWPRPAWRGSCSGRLNLSVSSSASYLAGFHRASCSPRRPCVWCRTTRSTLPPGWWAGRARRGDDDDQISARRGLCDIADGPVAPNERPGGSNEQQSSQGCGAAHFICLRCIQPNREEASIPRIASISLRSCCLTGLFID